MTPSALKSTAKEKTKSAAKKKQSFITGDGTKNGKKARSIGSNKNVIEANKDLDEKGEIIGQRLETKRNTVEMKKTQHTQPEIPIEHQTECKLYYRLQIVPFCRYSSKVLCKTVLFCYMFKCLFVTLLSHFSKLCCLLVAVKPACSESMTTTPEPVPTSEAGN